MFSQSCPLCSADALNLGRHIAWHVRAGHEFTPEEFAEVDRLEVELRSQVEEKATTAEERTHCANCGQQVLVTEPHRVGDCAPLPE